MLMMALMLLLIDVMMVQLMVLTGLIVVLSDSILLTVNVLQTIVIFLVTVVVAVAAALESLFSVVVVALDVFHVQIYHGLSFELLRFVSLPVEQPNVNMMPVCLLNVSALHCNVPGFPEAVCHFCRRVI